MNLFKSPAKSLSKFLQKGISLGIFSLIFWQGGDVFAQGVFDVNGFGLSSSDDTLKSVAEIAAMAIQIFTFISLFILSLVGKLVGTDFITGPEAMAAIRPMWIFMRNLTNIGFVVALVYLAFSNLFASFAGDGAPSSLWKIKEKLPRIILALVAVNFSLLGFRIVIDAINVGTTAIFGIADVQLESQSATSVDSVLKNKAWSVMATPESTLVTVVDPETGTENEIEKYFAINGDETLKPSGLCGDYVENAAPATEAQIYYVEEFKDSDKSRYDNKVLACTSFQQSINDIFCKQGTTESDECFFKLREDLSQSQFVTSGNDTAQNLFMSFGTVFMRLERLPMLAADIDSILQVIDNTLFSLILAAAYVIVLIALFIVLILRVVILWLGIVFSPVIVAGAIMGFGTGALDEKLKLSTMLLVPIKVAGAFAISFVMLSGMIEFRPDAGEGIFEFGAALSSLAVDEYALLWQVITIVVFWKAANWALEGTEADGIVKGLMGGAEKIGGFLARSATTEAQIFTVTDEKSSKQAKIGLAGLISAPLGVIASKESMRRTQQSSAYSILAGNTFQYAKSQYENSVRNKEDIEGIRSDITNFTSNYDQNRLKTEKDIWDGYVESVFTPIREDNQRKLIQYLMDKKGINGLNPNDMKASLDHLKNDTTQRAQILSALTGSQVASTGQTNVEAPRETLTKDQNINYDNGNKTYIINSPATINNRQETEALVKEVEAGEQATFENAMPGVNVTFNQGDFENGKLKQEKLTEKIKASPLKDKLLDAGGNIKAEAFEGEFSNDERKYLQLLARLMNPANAASVDSLVDGQGGSMTAAQKTMLKNMFGGNDVITEEPPTQ